MGQVGESLADDAFSAVALSANGTIMAGSIWAVRDRVRVLRYHSATNQWSQIGEDINGEATDDEFGDSVALSASGIIMAAGAVQANARSVKGPGYVRVFRYDIATNQWNQVGQALDGEALGDYFGDSVAMSADGRIVATGASQKEGNSDHSGYVRVFQLTNATDQWNQVGQDIKGEAVGDYFGESLALSADGTILAAGSVWNEGRGGGSGHVRVFLYDRATSQWKQKGQDINGEAAVDRFGGSVALSSDGTTMAAGARWNDGKGGNSGHLRVFRYTDASAKWIQIGRDIDGEAAGDELGWTVALSGDGTVVASSSREDVGNSNDAAYVRVFGAIE